MDSGGPMEERSSWENLIRSKVHIMQILDTTDSVRQFLMKIIIVKLCKTLGLKLSSPNLNTPSESKD
jgi:hypothetical protein